MPESAALKGGATNRFEEKMNRLTVLLESQMSESARLDALISTNLKELGYGG